MDSSFLNKEESTRNGVGGGCGCFSLSHSTYLRNVSHRSGSGDMGTPGSRALSPVLWSPCPTPLGQTGPWRGERTASESPLAGRRAVTWTRGRRAVAVSCPTRDAWCCPRAGLTLRRSLGDALAPGRGGACGGDPEWTPRALAAGDTSPGEPPR